MRKLSPIFLPALVAVWLSAGTGPAAAGSELLERASAAAVSDPASASSLYREALSSMPLDDPERVEATLELAALLDRQGDFSGVLDALSSLADSLPVRGHLLRAAALEGTGRPLEALREIVSLLPSLGDVEAEEASARARALMETMGEEDLLELAETEPATPEGLYATLRLARLRVATGRGREAEPLLERLLALNTGEPLAAPASRLLTRVRAARAARAGHVGLVLPLTGPLAPFGKSALRGALLASALLRPGAEEAGGPALTLLIADSGSAPEATARALEELAAQGAVAVLGPMKGDAARVAAESAHAIGVPLITLTPARGHEGGEVFRLFLREEEEVDRLVRFAVTSRGMRRLALLVPDTEMGRRYRALFWDAAVRYGAEIVGSESFSPADKSLEIPLKRMTGIYKLSDEELRERFDIEQEDALLRLTEMEEASPPEVPLELPDRLQSLDKFKPRPIVDFDGLFLPVSSVAAAQFAPQLPYHDVTGVTLLGIHSWNYESFVNIGEQYVENALFPSEWHDSTPEGSAFVDAFTRVYGESPGAMEAYAYDAVRILSSALVAGQANDRVSAGRFLSRLSVFPAVTGPLTSLPGGDIAVEPKILTATNRRITAAPPTLEQDGRDVP